MPLLPTVIFYIHIVIWMRSLWHKITAPRLYHPIPTYLFRISNPKLQMIKALERSLFMLRNIIVRRWIDQRISTLDTYSLLVYKAFTRASQQSHCYMIITFSGDRIWRLALITVNEHNMQCSMNGRDLDRFDCCMQWKLFFPLMWYREVRLHKNLSRLVFIMLGNVF